MSSNSSHCVCVGSASAARHGALLSIATISLLILPGSLHAQTAPNYLTETGTNSVDSGSGQSPKYGEPTPSSWKALYIKPSISYNTLTFRDSSLGDAKGLSLGASAGYDFNYNNFVFGPAVSLNYDFLKSRSSTLNDISGYKARVNFDGTAGVRAGMQFGRVLIYGTGGYAFASMRLENNDNDYRDSRLLSGWAAGGGLEYSWNDANSVRLGYQRIQYTRNSFDAYPLNIGNVRASVNNIDIGIVHRF